MGLMDWVYMIIGAAGFLGGVGVAWGVNRSEATTTRRDLDRLRSDFKDFQRETRGDIQQLFILRIKNGHNGHKGPSSPE